MAAKETKIKKTYFIICPLLILITIITSKVILKKELIMDHFAYDILVKQLRNPTLTTIMKWITKLSDVATILILAFLTTIIFYKYIKNKKAAYAIPINITAMTLLNQMIKFLIKRNRPINKLIKISGYSFPSGHAMISAAFYGTLSYLINLYIKNKILKTILIGINIIIIILIGISRIYLGVHYLSDVLVGYSISIIYLTIIININHTKKILP